MDRVTNSGISATVLANNQMTLGRLAQYQEQMSSGKRINRVSDDPVVAKIALGYRQGAFESGKYLDNVNKATSFMTATDSTLGEMSQILDQVKQLGVQGANGSQDATSRRALAQSIDSYLDRTVDLANTVHDGRYLFSGTATLQKPFARNAAGTGVDYSGNLDTFDVSIGPGAQATVNQNGNELFKGQTDIFKTLTDLRDALTQNDTAAISGSLAGVDAAAERVNDLHGAMGGRMQRLDLARNQLERTKSYLEELTSQVEDVDLADTYSKFNLANTALQAGLRAGASVLQTSLVDFLR